MAEGCPVVYCLIPPELAEKLHEPLRRHFLDEPGIEVIVEQRWRERRARGERRAGKGGPPAAGERRQVRSPTGRRMGERRAALVPLADAPQLPRRARRYAERIAFVRRVEPATQQAEDRDTARVVARFQAGDPEAFSTLYTRYYDRVYGYLRVALRNPHDAEDATQEVFAKLLETLSRYERRRQPFRHFLFTVVRNCALDELEKRGRVEPVPGEELERLEGGFEAEAEPELTVLDWLTDQDLRVFVERLPETQRKILVLRFVLGFSSEEMGELLGCSAVTVRAQQSRAVRTLRERMEAVGHRHLRARRMETLTRVKPARVISRRRFALTAGVSLPDALTVAAARRYATPPASRPGRW